MTVLLYSPWEVLYNGDEVLVCYSLSPEILWLLGPNYCKSIVLGTHSDPSPDEVAVLFQASSFIQIKAHANIYTVELFTVVRYMSVQSASAGCGFL